MQQDSPIDKFHLPPLSKAETETHPTFREALRVWVKIALLSFGGPAGQIAVMHRLLVEEKKWMSESHFLHALSFCMMLPGPEAQQLATYCGWLLHRTAGGLVAGILFILPGFLSILVLSILYAGYQHTDSVQALFYGLKPAVLAIVLAAMVHIARRALKHVVMYAIAAGAFVAIYFFEVSFPVIILAAAIIGLIFKPITNKTDSLDRLISHTKPSVIRSIRVLIVCLTLWFAPLVILWAIQGSSNIYLQEGLFFSKVAVITFGGAYAVLAYVAQESVNSYQWLAPGEMLDGLGMAETTPGPLIQVVQFVGFMGAFRNPGTVNPFVAGTLASILITWITFVPCFLWIFLGAPFIEFLRKNRFLTSALTSITAAVVGVILNLAVWFGLHTLFSMVDEERWFGIRVYIPSWMTLDIVSFVLAVFAFYLLIRSKLGMIPTLATCTLLGMAYRLFLT